MKEDVSAILVCPKKRGADTCRGRLFLEEVFSYSKGEVKEGYLRCKACSSHFPIFFGIPVIVSDVPKYLRENFCIILELSRRYGEINKNLIVDSLALVKRTMPRGRKELFSQPRREYARRVRNIIEDDYILSHYESPFSLAVPEEPLYSFLARYSHITPHIILEKFLKSYSNSGGGIAAEVGCGAGGFLKGLAHHSRIVFGIDNSFEKLFLASSILKHMPVRISQYRVIMEASIRKKREIDVGPVTNLELIVGMGDNLPFRDSSLYITSSCNLVDVIDNPVGLFMEKIRVLKKGGLLLCSDPYQFLGENRKKLKIKRGQPPWERLREVLRPKVKILEERDYVPWITRRYKRHYSIYYSHSFCGKKV